MISDSRPVVTVSNHAPELTLPGRICCSDEENMYIESQVFIPVVEGEAYVSIAMNGWRFSADDGETQLRSECQKIKQAHQKCPDDFDENSRQELKRDIDGLVRRWIDEKKIVPE